MYNTTQTASAADHIGFLGRRKAAVMAKLEAHPFHAPLWLRSAHLQTVWSPLYRRVPPIDLRRESWPTPDDDRLYLYSLDGDPGKPTVVILHGLEGTVQSNYVQALFHRFHRIGWNVVAMEYRGCSGEENRARRLYHNGETTDLAFVVHTLVERDPAACLYLAGFSLGGNITGLWLGKHFDEVPPQICGAAVISAPYEPTIAGPHIDRVLGGVYARHFLKGLVPKAIAKERQYPGCIDIERVRQCRTLWEFDEYATAKLHGFAGADDYWTRTGSGQFLHQIHVPTLLLSAADDPFNPASTLPRRQADESPWLHGLFPNTGGHVGFVYGSPWATRHWAEEQIMRFFQAIDAES